MMKYKVSINYYDFLFDSSEEALAFAEQAKLHYCKDVTDKSNAPEVTIKFIIEDEKEDE